MCKKYTFLTNIIDKKGNNMIPVLYMKIDAL